MERSHTVKLTLSLLRLTSSQPTAQKSQPAKSVTSTRPRTTPPVSTTDAAPVAATAVSEEPPALPATTAASDEPTPALPVVTGSQALSLIGKSETELRAMLGAPTSEEDRPPGKRGAIETADAPWTSSSIRTSGQNSLELSRTR